MSQLVQQLLDLLKQWHPAPNTDPTAILDLLRAQVRTPDFGVASFIIRVSREGSDVIRKGLSAAPKKGFTTSFFEDLA